MGDKPIYLPQQKTRRGVAGYRGDNVHVVDDKGHSEEAPAPKTKRQPAARVTGPKGGR